MWYEIWIDGELISEHESKEEAFKEIYKLKNYKCATLYKCVIARTKIKSFIR